MAIARACLPNVSPERCELIVDRGERKGPLGVRVPSCFPVERYGELHGFFEVSWIDENVLSLDHDLSALSEERCEDIHDGNLVGIELSNEASGSQLNAEHRGIRLRVQEIRHCGAGKMWAALSRLE